MYEKKTGLYLRKEIDQYRREALYGMLGPEMRSALHYRTEKFFAPITIASWKISIHDTEQIHYEHLSIFFDSNSPVPVTWIALAKVKTKTLFNSSLSTETRGLGSEKDLDNCGCTSPLPKPVMSLNAVLSKLEINYIIRHESDFQNNFSETLEYHKCNCVWFVCGTAANECKWDNSWTR